MRHIRIFFQAVFLSVFSIAAVSGIEPGIIFDGISRLHGSGWSDPKETTSLAITSLPVLQNRKGLEFRAGWTNYWAGGGWNWHNWQPGGDDLRPYNALSLKFRKVSGELADFWFQLGDADRKSSGQVRLLASGLLSEITGEFQTVLIPLPLFDGDYDRMRVSTLNFGVMPGTQQKGECVLQFADIRLVHSDEVRNMEQAWRPPSGAEVSWSLDGAWSRSSSTNGKICLNGYWNFLPADNAGTAAVPQGEWGWFKVPGIWPNPQGLPHAVPAQDIHLPPGYAHSQTETADKLDQAWYRRTVTVPETWRGRRIEVDFTLLQTHARVFLDGRPAGEAWFPGGPVELTPLVKFGKPQELAVFVSAKPVEAGAERFMAPDRLVAGSSAINLKGLTGDVFLTSAPMQDRIVDIRVETSVRSGEIAFFVTLADVRTHGVLLEAEIRKNGSSVKHFSSEPMTVPAAGGPLRFSAPWSDAELWDPEHPQNVYEATVTLKNAANGRLLSQSLPISFGFREFWIDGRDFRLNGHKVHLRAALLTNPTEYADQAARESALRSMHRMKEFGFNFFITGNYGFTPGQVGYLRGVLDAADESGTLYALSLPHIGDFGMKLDDPETAARYRTLTHYLVRQVQNRPAAILYTMNHNALGYGGDQNPDRMDGLLDPAKQEGATGSFLAIRKQGRLAEAVATEFDPSRPVYHHESGNFGNMHTVNIYLNWSPRQERSDWLEHWAAEGSKPLFFVEWGMPHLASWLHYRGPAFIWTTPVRTWAWASEFAAACLGDAAYRLDDAKLALLERERKLLASGENFGGWELTSRIQALTDLYSGVQAWYMQDNWRAMRGWGISAVLPWDQVDFWQRVRPTAKRPNPAARQNLHQPGIVPDHFTANRNYLNDPEKKNFRPTPTGEVLLRDNQPLLAFLGGAPVFTDKTHIYKPGEPIHKQLIIINDHHSARDVAYLWRIGDGEWSSRETVRVDPGETVAIPLEGIMPESASGTCRLEARISADGRERVERILLHLPPGGNAAEARAQLRLFDPKGMSASALRAAGVEFTPVTNPGELADGDALLIGREAFDAKPSWALPPETLAKLRGIVVFEQSSNVLNNRFGFRVTEWGAREGFVRTPEHPVMAGFPQELLANWRGDATLTPGSSPANAFDSAFPRSVWNGFDLPRVWRRGNRNAVASVLIEKPSRGNWLPLVDCGFDLQYTPLLEHQEAGQRILFCQMDLSGRTENDPAAAALLRRIADYIQRAPAPAPGRTLYYAGNDAGVELLTRLGVAVNRQLPPAAEPEETLLVLGPEATPPADLRRRINAGLRVLALGADNQTLAALGMNAGEAVDAIPYYEPDQWKTLGVAGISHADTYWRRFPKLAPLPPSKEGKNSWFRRYRVGRGTVTILQAAPWNFDYTKEPALRSSYRRNVFLLSRFLATDGAEMTTPLRNFFTTPAPLLRQDLSRNWCMMPEEKIVNATENAWKPDFDDSGWQQVTLPHYYDDLGYGWYRLEFEPSPLLPEELTLSLGPVDDESQIWLNGKFLGEVTKANAPMDYWCRPRDFAIRRSELLPGRNVIAVRVKNIFRDGGMAGSPRLFADGPWLNSYYLQTPEEEDDPYRYYRW